MDSGLWPDWNGQLAGGGDGEMKSGNQFSVDQTIMAKCMVGVGSQNSREPCEETSGPLPCSLSPALMGDLKEPRHGGEWSVDGNQ